MIRTVSIIFSLGKIPGYLFTAILLIKGNIGYASTIEEFFVPTAKLNLPIKEIRKSFPPYSDFCEKNPGECDMTGDVVVNLSTRAITRILEVNSRVNKEIRFTLDNEFHNEEECWDYPVQGRGDCEDMALEKRRRLVAIGFPRGALRMAIGQHRRTLSAHAVLTVETTNGTYILDSENESFLLWYQTEYNFVTRERPDGRWERYDQRFWTY